jgi:Na+/H+-dicarboxylate symporter
LHREETWIEGTNMLGLIVCAIVFGVAIAVVGEDANIVLNFFDAIFR